MSTVLFRHTSPTFLYVSCPLLSVENALGPGQPDINGHQPDTGGVTHEFRTNRKLTYEDRTSDGNLCPFYPVENFEHAQNFPIDGMDVTGHRRTRSGFTGYETDIKRIRTDKNGHERIKLFHVRFSSVTSV
ncbi:hypothetical protein DPMN_131186 [Dreissena polymorpha]|uniref:Uncharacterized protein n=1 Tax=Dreissena polymorpha TaxID=45954 RepID=A0A9D4H455_DREPO|nr:hypothetical protein DPMN_131186 [Dreissena polymorpha]